MGISESHGLPREEAGFPVAVAGASDEEGDDRERGRGSALTGSRTPKYRRDSSRAEGRYQGSWGGSNRLRAGRRVLHRAMCDFFPGRTARPTMGSLP